LQAVERLEKYRIPVEDITAELIEVLPDSVILSSLQLSRERRLILKGKANDFKALFTFADGLRKSTHFASVSPERTEGGEPGQGGSFTITVDLAQVEKLTSLTGRGARWR
jgi:Tfp pilus assembly protein PilN